MTRKQHLISVLFLWILLFPVSGQNAPWKIDNDTPKVIEKFFIQEQVETYTGEEVLFEIEERPTAENVFVLVSLRVEKEETNAPDFLPDNLVLKIGNNTFNRLKNDAFLVNYHYTVIPHLPLKFGAHKGVILFEIPHNLKQEKMTLFYHHKDKELK